jgi:hypothetical protein
MCCKRLKDGWILLHQSSYLKYPSASERTTTARQEIIYASSLLSRMDLTLNRGFLAPYQGQIFAWRSSQAVRGPLTTPRKRDFITFALHEFSASKRLGASSPPFSEGKGWGGRMKMKSLWQSTEGHADLGEMSDGVDANTLGTRNGKEGVWLCYLRWEGLERVVESDGEVLGQARTEELAMTLFSDAK